MITGDYGVFRIERSEDDPDCRDAFIGTEKIIGDVNAKYFTRRLAIYLDEYFHKVKGEKLKAEKAIRKREIEAEKCIGLYRIAIAELMSFRRYMGELDDRNAELVKENEALKKELGNEQRRCRNLKKWMEVKGVSTY